MNIRTHTFYLTKDGQHAGDLRKLKPETIKKRGGTQAFYMDIDIDNPSKGYFNERKISDL